MSRPTVLPPQFAELEGKIDFLARVGSNEYSATCPECHGDVHEDGSYPDRFRLFISSRATGGPCGWCRRCGYTWIPGKGRGGWKPDPATLATWEAERRAAEERRLNEVEHALEILNREQLWRTYHEALNFEAMEEWRRRGIEDYTWLAYWQLGYCQTFTVNYKEGDAWLSYESDTLSIPVYDCTGQVVSLRHRLLHPQRSQDRYRPALKGLPAAPFICDLDRPMAGPLLLVEGEIKAMVSYITADNGDLHVVGLPGKSPDLDTLAKFANCEPVYLCLDPDAYQLTAQEMKQRARHTAAQRLTLALDPKRVRWITLPDKIDDMITAGVLNKRSLLALMNNARKAWMI